MSRAPPPLPECSICLEEIHPHQIYILNSCKHIFHKHCLRKHLLSDREIDNGIHPCPNCRTPIPAKQAMDVVPDYVHRRLDQYMLRDYTINLGETTTIHMPVASINKNVEDLEAFISVAQQKLEEVKKIKAAFEVITLISDQSIPKIPTRVLTHMWPTSTTI